MKDNLISVLLVEDDTLIRVNLASELSSAGFDVAEAINGDDAARILASDSHFDVLLTDISMPGSMDGVALSRHVTTSYPGIAVMAISGVGSNDTVPRGIRFFAKPYEVRQIVAAIKAAVFGYA